MVYTATITAKPETTFRNPVEAFDDAIAAGRLSADENAALYAGNFMYMGTKNGVDLFKNIDTRAYLGAN